MDSDDNKEINSERKTQETQETLAIGSLATAASNEEELDQDTTGAPEGSAAEEGNRENTPSSNVSNVEQSVSGKDENVEETTEDARDGSDSDSDYVIDPQSITRSSIKSKVAGRLIDRLWNPLPVDSLNSIEKILSMCVNQSIQRYAPVTVKGKSKSKIFEPSKMMLEAQQILRDGWLSSGNRSSFASRLKETPLPVPVVKGTVSFGRRSRDGVDQFNFDTLQRRKKYLETYLLAELKQLNELENNYKLHESVYELDKKYLNELRRSTTKENSKKRNEISKKRSLLSIDKPLGISNECRVKKRRRGESKFNPDEDADTLGILESLTRHLSSIRRNTLQLKDINTELESLFNLLEGQ